MASSVVLNVTPSHDEDGIGKCMMIQVFEDMARHVDEKLDWFNW